MSKIGWSMTTRTVSHPGVTLNLAELDASLDPVAGPSSNSGTPASLRPAKVVLSLTCCCA